MKIVIVSWGKEGKQLYHLLKNSGRDRYEVCWIAEENSALWQVLNEGTEKEVRVGSYGGAVRLFQEGEAERFLIPSVSENPNGWSISEKIGHFGIPESAMLYAPVEVFREDSLSANQKIDLICPFEKRRELDFMEVHAADHCNLNCKNCSMFSGLVKGEVYADYEKTAAGLRKLKEFFTHVKVFRVLGGEPLLNERLSDYLYLIREIYPYAEIRVISNGILVPKMSGELIQALRENDVSFIVTGYPALDGIADQVNDFLRGKKIRHVVSPTVMQFQKIYNAGGNSDIRSTFSNCNWKNTCANMKKGRIAACFVPFVFPYFSEQFKLDLPKDESIDLFEAGLTTEIIRTRMEQPMELCKYCVSERCFAKWERMDKDSLNNIEDWAVK